MKRVSFLELQEREMINLCTGEKLGFVCDLDMDVDIGQILSVTVLSQKEVPFFKKREEYIIPWRRIECIGEDTLLVKIPANELCNYQNACGKKKCKM